MVLVIQASNLVGERRRDAPLSLLQEILPFSFRALTYHPSPPECGDGWPHQHPHFKLVSGRYS